MKTGATGVPAGAPSPSGLAPNANGELGVDTGPPKGVEFPFTAPKPPPFPNAPNGAGLLTVEPKEGVVGVFAPEGAPLLTPRKVWPLAGVDPKLKLFGGSTLRGSFGLAAPMMENPPCAGLSAAGV